MTYSRDFRHKQQGKTVYPYSQYSPDLPDQPPQHRMENKLDEILRRLTALEAIIEKGRDLGPAP